MAQRFPLVLDFGSEGLQGSIRFYGAEFAGFDEAVFSSELQPICAGEAYQEKIGENEIVTFAATNRKVVEKGLEVLQRYILGDNVADLTHINLERGEFLQGIFLRRNEERVEEVWVKGGRILRWQEFGIDWDGDMDGVDVFLV